MNKLHFAFACLLCALSAAVMAEDTEDKYALGTSQEPLAIQGDVVLTQAEIDAAFSKIPPRVRLPFIRSGDKVELLVRNLLRAKILANEARKAGFDQEVLVQLRLKQAEEQELATDWVQRVVDDAPEVDYEALAYESYLVDPKPWLSAELVDVSHILVSSETRSPEAALELATSLREQLVADPSLFESLVEEYSDDPSKAMNGGRFPGMKKGDMVKPFEEAAFAMENIGGISAPVKTNYGYHIIRLNQRYPSEVLPFEEIKARAMEQARVKYLEDYEKQYLRTVLSDTVVLPEGAAEAMAKRYFGENLELAPKMED